VHEEGRACVVDAWGNVVVPWGEYDWMYSWSDGEYVYLRNAQGRSGVVDVRGWEIIPFVWDDVGGFSEGLLAVCADGLWGYVNSRGRTVLPCRWEEVRAFCDGAAMVKQDGRWHMIDMFGERLMDESWDEVAWEDQDGLMVVAQGGRQGLVSMWAIRCSPANTCGSASFPKASQPSVGKAADTPS